LDRGINIRADLDLDYALENWAKAYHVFQTMRMKMIEESKKE
jgi:hypothetical protein